ncbi:hypothetical protein ACI77O_12315 [Pseudomonas tritici]|uniref:hypothetical protein n=1 Tax=Pseudomonas tritici TaxID=2745518 RepID=UPI00387A87FD
MITENSRTKDLEDVGLLFYSILRYGEQNAERLDRSIVSFGYSTLMLHAERAAVAVAERHIDEGDNWDGCLWLERLESTANGSLAQQLYCDEPDVEGIVEQWLSNHK